ncbi:MAG: hypothetical protein IT521_05580 [Burkholderiales bacterium]|nr:hypothetical protein [Burkholderiales bacterium]
MSTTPPSLELLPMDPAASAAPAPSAAETIEITPMERVTPAPSAPESKVDRFAREAAQQYAEGHIDQPLWDRAYAQANGDRNEASEIYLRARATALRLLDRERRSRKAEQRGQASDDAAESEAEREPVATVASARFGLRRVLGRYRMPLIAAGVLLPLVVGGWLLFSNLGGQADDDSVARVAAAFPTAPPKPAKHPGAMTDAGAKAEAKAALMKKIQAFRDAGNWNMLVLYSVEWTRQEPDSVAAWNQLRAGYLNLHQYEDALGAARKVVAIAPADARMWRELAQVNVSLEDLAGALRAYEQAAVRDPRDIESLRQIAALNARLGCVAESKQAFDRALALAPDDAVTLRLRAAAAQQASAPKETHAAARQVKATPTQCGAGNDTLAVVVK